ncbi:MAG: KTSC domain-containing protein [Pedobacter sp.]
MKMIPVDSSNVEAVGYDEKSSTLQVEFKNGGMYQYFDVPEDVFIGLRDASSVGGYLVARIKGTYRYSKV